MWHGRAGRRAQPLVVDPSVEGHATAGPVTTLICR
jgi:hypothetical protein